MKRLLAMLLGLALSVVALGGAVVAAPAYSPDSEELAFLDLINDYRGRHGLGALSLNTALGAAADYHSQDMAENGYFAHTLSDGTDAGQNIYNFGYTGSTWGENILAGTATAQEALVQWQNSPGHDAQMRNPSFQEIGIGRYYDANSPYGWYWTTTFGGGPAIVNESSRSDTTVVEAPRIDALPPAAEGSGDYLILDNIDTTTNVDPALTENSVVPAMAETVTAPNPGATEHAADTTTTSTLTEDGTALAPVAPTTACADWYSAQRDYEAAGGLAPGPGYVGGVGSDHDGIACEEAMVTG